MVKVFDVQSLADCECPHCRGALKLQRAPDPQEIVQDGIVCTDCGVGYDIIWGAPFLGVFESEDILGLIEIAANARDVPNADVLGMRRLEALLSAYHAAADRNSFKKSEPDDLVRAPWFANRYIEWLQFTELTTGISFDGLSVLDVGSGLGFDCFRLLAAGARVTALEYNPMLVRNGRNALPDARWIGGFAHILPFAAGTFDAVCCNAALHHMRDVSQALEEMLRVLKPRGWLITTGDPYRSRNYDIATEFEVFNRHPSVLQGINESLPSFTTFESVLSRYHNKLQIALITTDLYNLRFPLKRTFWEFLRGRPPAFKLIDIPELHVWNFDSHRLMLGDASGGIGIRCRLKASLHIAPRQQNNIVITAGDFAATLSDYSAAIQRLSALLPSHQIDRPFPGTEQTKFELLNGWQAPDGSEARTGYKRARWFLKRPIKAETICFDQRQVEPLLGTPAHIDVLINGHLATQVALTAAEWFPVKVPLKEVTPGEVFVCELQLVYPPGAPTPTFEQELFQVRDRRYDPQ